MLDCKLGVHILLVLFLTPTLLLSLNVERLQRGTLMKDWNFSFTIITDESEKFLLIDYEKNKFKLQFDIGTVAASYNKEKTEIPLKTICRCDSCVGRFISFNISAVQDVITFQCNNHQSYSVRKTNSSITKRVKLLKTTSILELLRYPNTLFMSVSFPGNGCINSISFNSVPIFFKSPKTNDTGLCPRKCSLNKCNGGQCRALYVKGPPCDCSYTPLNGKYCDNDLMEYNQNVNNSFIIDRMDSFIFFKLTWRKWSDDFAQRYCLLEIINEKANITLSIQETDLLMFSEGLQTILSNDTNYLILSLSNGNVTTKVNGIVVKILGFMNGKSILNVGFTKNHDACSVFKGNYDIEFRNVDLRDMNDNIEEDFRDEKKTRFLNEITIIIVVAASILLVIIVPIGIMACIIKQHRDKQSVKRTDDVDLKAIDSDTGSNYDSLDSSKIYLEHKDNIEINEL